MNNDIIVKSCKIEIYLRNDDKDKRIEMYKKLRMMARELRDVRNDALRMCIVYHQTNKIGVVGLQEKKKPDGSDIKHTYSTFINRNRRELLHAPKTLSAIAYTGVEKKFKRELKDYLGGNKNYPVFKDYRINISKQGSALNLVGKEYVFLPVSLRSLGYEFGFVGIEKDKSLKTILARIMTGEYDYGDSFIKIDGKKFYLFLTYKFKKTEIGLCKEIVCGVDMGWVVPAYVGLSEGFARKAIGDSALIKKFRTQIKSRRRRIQRQQNTMKGGHGLQRRMKSLDRAQAAEREFVKNQNHNISKQVIEFCIKNNAGTIHMENLTKEVKKSAFLTGYWSYYQLQQMIEYKANDKGITVEYVDPAYTSRTCPECGDYSKENRKTQSKFQCTKCGYPGNDEYINADYNAAVNIARSKNIVPRGAADLDDAKESPSPRRKGEGLTKKKAIKRLPGKRSLTQVTRGRLCANLPKIIS